MSKLNDVAMYIKKVSSPEKTITGKDIANHLGITDIEVRKQVSEARSAGVPICSTQYGYYYSNDSADIRKTIESLRRRIGSQERAISGLSDLLA